MKYFYSLIATDCAKSSNCTLKTQSGEDNTTLKKSETDELVYKEPFYSKAEVPNYDIILKKIQSILYEEATPLKSKSKRWNEQFLEEADIPIQTVSDLLLNNIYQYYPFINPFIHSSIYPFIYINQIIIILLDDFSTKFSVRKLFLDIEVYIDLICNKDHIYLWPYLWKGPLLKHLKK